MTYGSGKNGYGKDKDIRVQLNEYNQSQEEIAKAELNGKLYVYLFKEIEKRVKSKVINKYH